ncbi:hypothetical protein [Aliidiomarina sedimenti]|nr:hypothetical protein [Aliidiomarina sedimenti]
MLAHYTTVRIFNDMKEPPAIAGLLKFFSRPEYLDDFLQGKLFCNTPHYYRNCYEQGISDRFEACIGYFSRSLDQRMPTIIMDGKKLDLSRATEAFTFLDQDYYDSWLSCWFILEVPESELEIISLKRDLQRILQEFGDDYVLLPSESFIPFHSLLSKTEHRMENGPVKYTDDDLTRGMFKKRSDFSYQREYRFAFDRCDKSELKPLCFKVDANQLSELVIKQPKIKFNINGELHDILV